MFSAEKVKKTEKPQKPQEVDEYTARIDRMVNQLSKKSKDEHSQMAKTMLIWSGVGIVVVVSAILLMLSIDTTQFSEAFNFLK